MFDDKLLKLTEREVIALGKSRAEEKTGFEFGPQYNFRNIVLKNQWNEIIRTELNMDPNSRKKHLGHIMVKLLFQKMGKKVKKIIMSKLFSISILFIEFSFYFEVLKHIVMNI